MAWLGLLVLGLYISIGLHEFGHYLVAKWRGVGVSVFSIGVGDVLFSWTWRETEFRICLLPIAGYVGPVGDQRNDHRNEAEGRLQHRRHPGLAKSTWTRAHWLRSKKPWEKILFSLGGIAVNLLLAWTFAFLAVLGFGARSSYAPPTISRVLSPSQIKPVVEPGDHILSVEGKETRTWDDVNARLLARKHGPIKLVVERGSQQLTLELDGIKEEKVEAGEIYSPDLHAVGRTIEFQRAHLGVVGSAQEATTQVGSLFLSQFKTIPQVLVGLSSPFDLPHPWAILEVHHQRGPALVELWLLWLVIVNLSLAALNLLPVLPLDGGHVLFYLLEWLGIRVSPKTKQRIANAGGIGLLLLMVVQFLVVFFVR
jgi:regulator of sigma E protease